MTEYWYSNSLEEPIAIWKKWFGTAWLSRPQPSAILVGIEYEERRIWLVNAYVSSLGKNFVTK
jgi:hypothetical protein